jgi:hypothetical protein
LADFDGDGQVEILVVVEGSFGVTVVEPDGTLGDKSRVANSFLGTSPVVADVDNDGLLEILAGHGDVTYTYGEITVWDEGGSISDVSPWPMFHHDVARTGRHASAPQLGFPSELRFFHQPGTVDLVTKSVTLRNLGGGEFDWEIKNPIASLQVIPSSGRVSTQTDVTFTVDATGYAADVWHNLGSLEVAGRVGGEHVQSSPQMVSVWLFIGDLNFVYLPVVVGGL